MHGKTYNSIKDKTPKEAIDLSAAIAFLKEHARRRFDETVEIHLRLGVDPGQSDQLVRSQINLPAGTPAKPRLAVFTADASQQKEALAAGAHVAGGEDLIASVANTGKLEADATIATPSLMPKIAKIAKILGPKGLMPNPKIGTVTPNPVAAIRELLGGKVSFRMDQQGNVHVPVAKMSWESDKIAANVQAVIDAVRQAKPASVRGEYIRNITLASTMSPGIKLAI